LYSCGQSWKNGSIAHPVCGWMISRMMDEFEILERQIELKKQLIFLLIEEIVELKQKLNELIRLGDGQKNKRI